jgi:phosphoribosylanthranilate isomerase
MNSATFRESSSRLWIKICGITTEAAIDAAVRAQVDAIGFVFAPSKRRITPQRARELSCEVPASIARVAVFQHPQQTLLDEVCEILQPDFVQTDIEDLAALQVPDTVRVNPVVRSGRALPQPLPPRIVYEGPVSGTGTTVDWSEAARVARRAKLILAGGLNPENVAQAVRFVNPYGVDVSSGVEASAGIKDPALILRFVSAAREAQDVLVV